MAKKKTPQGPVETPQDESVQPEAASPEVVAPPKFGTIIERSEGGYKMTAFKLHADGKVEVLEVRPPDILAIAFVHAKTFIYKNVVK